MRKSYILCAVVVASSLLLSCTREIDESVNIEIDTSNLSNGVHSSPGAQSVLPVGYYPKVLLANLHYDGKTEVFEWECKDSTPLSSCAYPSNVNFSNKKFPNGLGRIVQVLLVYENDRDQLIFFYAHALNLNFSGGVVNVSINNWTNNGGSAGTGTVVGRYFDGISSGPTGLLIGSYSPPRPAGYTELQIPDMKLFRRYMFNGYFEVFFARGTNKFSWYLANETTEALTQKVFEQKSFDDFVGPLGASVLGTLVKTPDFYHVWLDSPSYYKSYFNAGEETIVGFFNSQVSPGAVNYFSTSSTPTKGFAFKNLEDGTPGSTEVIDYAYRMMNGSEVYNPINSSGSWVMGSPPTVVAQSAWDSYRLEVAYSIPTSDQVRIAAGQTTSAGACTSALGANFATDTCLKVIPGLAAKNSASPFRGPFSLRRIGASLPYNYNFIEVGEGAVPNTSKIQWKYMPGILNPTTPSSALVSGTDVYVIERDLIEHENEHEGLNCQAITELNPVLLGNIYSQDYLDQKLEFNNSTVAGFAKPEIVLCPYLLTGSQKKYYPFGLATQHFSPYTSVPPGTISVSHVLASSNAPIGIMGCTALTVYFSGGPTTAVATAQLTGAGMQFSTAAGCAGPTPSPFTATIPSGTNGTITFYVSAVSTPLTGVPINLTITGSDTFNIGTSPTMTFHDPITLTSTSPTTVPEVTCIPLTITRTSSAGIANVMVSNSSNSGKYFSDIGCTAAMSISGNSTTATINSGSLTKEIYFRGYVGTTGNETFSATYSTAPPVTLNRQINDSVKYVFISSTNVAGNFSGQSPDDFCTSIANTNRISGNYFALLSVNTESAKQKIESRGSGSKQYMTFDQQVVAPNSLGFFSLNGCSGLCSTLLSGINYTEQFTPRNAAMTWMGTTLAGQYAVNNCSNWGSTSGVGQVGNNDEIANGEWVDAGTSDTCSNMHPVYCIEDGT